MLYNSSIPETNIISHVNYTSIKKKNYSYYSPWSELLPGFLCH